MHIIHTETKTKTDTQTQTDVERVHLQFVEHSRAPVRIDRKSTRLNSSHSQQSRMPSSA